MACQVVHYPHHSQMAAEPAPEPRDVVWNKIAITPRERMIRSLIVMSAMTFLLLFWAGEFRLVFSLSYVVPAGARYGTALIGASKFSEQELTGSTRLGPRLAAELRRNQESHPVAGTYD